MPALSTDEQSLDSTARRLAETVLLPCAAQVDQTRQYPAEGLRALADEGLLGLLVPAQYGGRGGTLTDLALVSEALGWGCASTAMCFLMHSCACALIAAKATPEQGERWLRPAASGEARATLAFSERLTGAHFYNPEIAATRSNGAFSLSGRKSFVTSGGHAQLYPVLVKASGDPGLDILVLTPDLPGVNFDGSWDGVGMAGNSSIGMVLSDVAVPAANLLGSQGDGMELVFNVVAPTFLIGLAAVNIGIAQAALDGAVGHAKERHYADGTDLAGLSVIQDYLAEMSITTQSARQLVREAARSASAGEEAALPLVMQAKVAATEAAAAVTEQAMRVGGGIAYSRGLALERHWRDAHAGAVMAPTNEVLKGWLGKILAGLPLF
ncbi:MAG TPA: acyl-CoA dehydrogenase family protein [Dehalococcoidia bacterium]|nr:acyl-CoA dehydrogenase family protein [Dehalococcoidia bacterium]